MHSLKNDSGNLMYYSSLCSGIIKSPLGDLHALADDKKLIYLGFEPHEQAALDKPLLRAILKKQPVVVKKNDVLALLERELALYFNHQLTQFTAPIAPIGTPFQQQVWQALTIIPHGQTRSYKEQATTIGAPKAYRAVGAANGANMIVIVIPCHRVIAHNGELSGYTGTLERKQWLLNHEKK